MTEIIDKRIKTLNSVLSNKKDQDAVEKNFLASEGDWKTVSEALKTKLSEETFKKVSFAHSLADWSDDHIEIVKTLVEKPDVNNMRDVALRYNPGKLAAILKPEDVPENIDGDNEDEKKKNFAIALNHKLFNIEPTAVLQRMVDEGEIPIADPSISKGVTRVLSNLPDFNIRTTSVYTAFKQPDAFKEIPEEQRAGVMQEFKHLSLLTAISPIPKAVPVLKNANLTSAFHAAQMPESTFMAKFSSELGEETARQVYTNAINAHIRNEQALMTIHEAIKGTGLAIIDGKQTKEERLKSLQAVANDKAIPLNLETLFGSIDYCECDDCLSVYSPASYFVDILQYLRNNNLDPKVKSEPNDITNTPLENLFRRRPDLACLELTCENTFTVLPYVDLVNEVMESFVVHLDEYSKDPKQTILEVFNVTDETTSELLAQPQHTNYQAYCILKSAVYPFTLPYHQPIDAIRIWLKYMGTSRYELQDTFRTATETCANVVLTEDQQKWLKKLHAEVLDQAVDAEFLGITQEEYIILTREAFWPKDYFDFILKKEPTDDEYRKEIGVRKVHEYYGYDKEADMLELSKIGLTFVKKQFLPRTGIQYVDLVELLKTRFINPGYPQGKALAIMESIRFHYQYLKTKVNPNSPDPFADLIKFLNDKQQVAPPKDVTPNPDLCPQHSVDQCLPKTDFSDWVHCYFKRIGQLIVLESGDGPQLPVEGQLFIQSGPILFNLPNEGSVVNVSGRDVISNTAASDDKLIGSLGRDGKIVVEDDNGTTYIYTVTIEGQVIPPASQNSLLEKFIVNEIQIKDFEGNLIGKIKKSGSNDVLVDVRQKPDEISFKWVVKDTCDLDKVRLKHLDGSPLTVEEYDRMQCFIRLWRKLGWTIDETDKALIGLSASPSVEPTEPDKCDFVGFDAFQDKCIEEKGEDNGGCPDGKEAENCPEIPKIPDISPEFLHQLVAVRKLLDLTGLPLDKLLTFWAEISTVGEKSLYRSLFLTHNLLGIDRYSSQMPMAIT